MAVTSGCCCSGDRCTRVVDEDGVAYPGCGTPTDPIVIPGDGGSPGEVEVVAGCGLVGDGTTEDPIGVTITEWPFNCPPSEGVPFYCDDGILRGAPRHYNLHSIVQENLPGPFDLTGGETPIVELSITNPSPCYEATVVLIPRETARIQVMGLSHWELRSRILRVENNNENTVPIGGGMLPGPDTIQRIGVINGFPRQRADLIPPGGTSTYRASVFGFDGDGTFSSVNITLLLTLSTTSPI